jgi:uncharacterized protein YjbI with pentapeptide repeats
MLNKQPQLTSIIRRKLTLGELTFMEPTLREPTLRELYLMDPTFRKPTLGEPTLGGANLYGANFEGANLEGAILNGSNLQEANLEGTINLTIDQLAMVKTLYKAKLDDELMKQVKEKYPHLLKDPKKELEDSKKEGKGL